MSITMSTRVEQSLSNPQPRSLFAVLIRGEIDEATDMILDAIEGSKVDDSVWDWVLWSRGTSVYAIISAPLFVKGIISSVSDIRLLPIGSIAEKMEDNRNAWIYPKANARDSALVIAERLISSWVELQFVVDEAAKLAADLPLPSKIKERTRIATRAEVYTRSKNKEVRSQQQSDNTVAVLGLDRAKDSQGKGFTFTKLSE